jgi:hypothetical protein
MNIKNIFTVWFVAFILSSYAPVATVVPTQTAVPISTFSDDNWLEYSSIFTSNIGSVEYSLRYPKDWYVYPGSTMSEPGLEGQTYIQSYVRIDDNNSDYQPAGTVKLAIYALPCAGTEEGCDITGLLTLASDLPGVLKIDYRDGWTVWTVFLCTKDYRFSLDGYMPGTPIQNNDLIKVLDEILSTVVNR